MGQRFLLVMGILVGTFLGIFGNFIAELIEPRLANNTQIVFIFLFLLGFMIVISIFSEQQPSAPTGSTVPPTIRLPQPRRWRNFLLWGSFALLLAFPLAYGYNWIAQPAASVVMQPTVGDLAQLALVSQATGVPGQTVAGDPTSLPATALLPTASATMAPATPAPTVAALPTAAPTSAPVSFGPFAVSGYLYDQTICVQQGDRLRIRAADRVVFGANVGDAGPEGKESFGFGIPISESYDLVSRYPHGALLFRIYGSDDWRAYDPPVEYIAERDGCLEFDVNDNNQSDNQGAFQVTIEISR